MRGLLTAIALMGRAADPLVVVPECVEAPADPAPEVPYFKREDGRFKAPRAASGLSPVEEARRLRRLAARRAR